MKTDLKQNKQNHHPKSKDRQKKNTGKCLNGEKIERIKSISIMVELGKRAKLYMFIFHSSSDQIAGIHR